MNESAGNAATFTPVMATGIVSLALHATEHSALAGLLFIIGVLLYLSSIVRLFVQGLAPFLLGLTFVAWSIASGSIPLLLLLGVWRHVVRRHPLRYTGDYWAMVFPIGMYATCTHRLSQVLGLGFLGEVSAWSTCVALAVWALTFWGMVGGGAPFLRTAGSLLR